MSSKLYINGKKRHPGRGVLFLVGTGVFDGPLCNLLEGLSGGQSLPLVCCVQHIFDEDALATGWIIYKDMGHSAHQFSILNNGTAAHE